MKAAVLLVRLIGYPGTLLYGDTAVFDRWLWLRKNLRGGRVRTLDVGCGSGAFTLYAAKVGNEAIGISFESRKNEIATERAKLLRLPNARFVTGDIRELRAKSELGSFDQIICFETIEHIANDAQLMQDISHILRPGGRLLLTTPYRYYHHLPGDAISDVEDGGHVRWGYSHPEMKQRLSNAGLATVTQEYVTGPLSQCLIRIQRMLSRAHPLIGWAVVLPLRWVVAFDPFLMRISDYPSLSIAVVGEKVR